MTTGGAGRSSAGQRGQAAAARAIVAVLGVVALSGLSGCCGCCNIFPDPRKAPETSPPPEPTGVSNEPPPVGVDAPILTSGSLVNLGVVVYPAGTPPGGAASHAWTALKLKPSAHKLGYALGADEKRAVENDLQDYARKVRYQARKKGVFEWQPPKGCVGDMHCVLESLMARSGADIAPIAERFKKRVKEAKLNSLDAAAIVVGFVQAIPYEVPADEPFGLLAPARVAYERRGDCDSKALLGYMLLASLGISSVVISSEAHKHAMLGIALPAGGTTFTYQGTRYAYAEMTAKGSPIGHINSELLTPNDWKVVPIRPSAGSGP